MIRAATVEDETTVLAAARAASALGALCEMQWQLWRQNPHMPHRFYLDDGGALLKQSGRRAMLCGTPQDPEELALLLRMQNIGRLSAVGFAPAGWPVVEQGHILQRPAQGPRSGAAPPRGYDPAPTADEVLDVLESTDGRMQPEGVREGFWVDMHIRRNHGVACIAGIRRGGQLVCTAGLYAITGNAAYLACVETLPGHRGRGYATALVRCLCAQAAPLPVQLICLPPLVPFYTRLGFAHTGSQSLVSKNPHAEESIHG